MLPNDSYYFALDYSIFENDDYDPVIRFYLVYGDSTQSRSSYMGGIDDTPEHYIEYPFVYDEVYHIAVVFDENMRLWLYINGAVVSRICGKPWPQTQDDTRLIINNSAGYYYSDSTSGCMMVDTVALYNKAVDSNTVNSHTQYIQEAVIGRKEDRIHFRNKRNKYASLENQSHFMPYKKQVKTVQYNDALENWETTVDTHDKNIISVSASYDHATYLYEDGTMSGVGNNDNNQIELATITNAIHHSAMEGLTVVLNAENEVIVIGSPVDAWNIKNVPVLSDRIVDVVCGLEHVVVLTSTGEVHCWGRNDNNQCDVPINLPMIVRVAASDDTSYAVDNNGNVWSWGFGEEGLTDTQNIDQPIVDIVADGHDVLMVTSNNEIRHIGYVELGNIVTAPMDIITAIGVGKNNCLVTLAHKKLVADGILQYTLTNNTDLNAHVDESTVYDIRADVSGGYINRVFVGNQVAFALDGNGSLDGWGRSSYDNSDVLNVPSDLEPVVNMAVYNHAVTVDINSSVRAWGRNRYNSTNVPSGLSDIQDIIVSQNTNYAIKGNGTVVVWGDIPTWYPTQIVPNYRKVIFMENSDDGALVIDDVGTVHEYRNDNIVTEYANKQNVLDILIFDHDVYDSDGYVPVKCGYILYRDGSAELINAPSDIKYELKRRMTMIEKDIATIEGEALIDIEGRAYFEDIWEYTGAMRISKYDQFQNRDPVIITANSRVRFWHEDKVPNYIGGNLPPYLSVDNE